MRVGKEGTVMTPIAIAIIQVVCTIISIIVTLGKVLKKLPTIDDVLALRHEFNCQLAEMKDALDKVIERQDKLYDEHNRLKTELTLLQYRIEKMGG